MGTLLERYISVIAFIIVVMLWEGGCRLFNVQEFILPSPFAIVGSLSSLPAARWMEHILATLGVALSGFAVAIAVALPLASAIVSSRLLSRLLMPWLVVIQSTPIVAIAPIIVVCLGAGVMPRVLITMLIAFFPIVISTATGLNSVPPEMIELSRSLRASRAREYWQIRMPYAIPYIFSALKVAITLSIIGAVVAEFVAAEQGLGYLILFSTSSFKMPLAFASLLILVCSTLTLYGLVVWIHKRLFAWSIS
ncbi:ABC transporter permease [Pseudomonas fluorescens]|uniref:ABC transporter permease n=1 Tax=Pseudomonas fluorescens TaxID=294 RepID=UPI0019076B8A|nr:ABC transporter permease [Pseudomonas fluorescens]MBD8094602.1 ABC transporter permease [Pseudomonas fluorescens]MBD8720487.1 ABC transporter permease [Pseudomonas fluorescens]